MSLKWKHLALATLPLFGMSVAQAAVLTSLEWPPYTSASLPEQGKSSQVVTAAFALAGDPLTIKFYPWQRAVDEATNNPEVLGYFPEYLDPKSSCLFSDPIGNGPLGFAQRTDQPVTWQSLDDLKGKKIGVVTGYVNTTEFDEKVASKALSADATNSDSQNLLKLGNGRLDLAVIDQNVMTYLLESDPQLKDVAANLGFNGKILEDKSLHVCFTNSAKGKEARDKFNKALASDEVKKLMK
ncbi:TPA: substrate-binding periplasmic protein [Aeromonas veronii]